MIYRTIDWYEGKEIIYKGNSLKEARQARKQRYLDTDDEADVTIEEQHINLDGRAVWVHTSY